MGTRWLYIESEAPLLFTENETDNGRIFGTPNASPYVKDAINEYLVHGRLEAVNPAQVGTKVACCHQLSIAPGQSAILGFGCRTLILNPWKNRSEVSTRCLSRGLSEANEFYSEVIPSVLDADHSNVTRQALAGMLWSKQFYFYDVDQWLHERGADPFYVLPHTAPRKYPRC